MYRHGGWTWAGDEEDAAGAEEWEQTSPELTDVHDTLLTAMPQLRDPRGGDAPHQ